MTPRKALVLDASARYRLRVAAVLDEHPAIEVIGAVSGVDDALRRSARQPPDLVVLDADFGSDAGLGDVKRLLAAIPDLDVWVLTDQGTPRGPRAQAALKLGVKAWLVKPPMGVSALRDTLHPTAETLLVSTSGAEAASPDPDAPRKAVLPALKAVAPGTVRVRASAPAPPAEPMPVEPRVRPRTRRAQTPLSADPTAPAPPAPAPPAPATEATAARTLPARATQARPPQPAPQPAPAPSAPAARARRTPIPPRPLPPRRSRKKPAPEPAPPPPPPRPSLVVIGASTGGPEALALVLAELPADLDVPVVVVQHMPAFFLARFAERLHAQGPLPTSLARHDSALAPGHVYVAPGDFHLEIRGGPGAYRANVRAGKRVHGCRPAVDVTLMSLARAGAGPTQVIILTGMGRDGADGAKALLAHDAHVIAQDKETSVVWGMPGAVHEDGSAHLTLPLNAIPDALKARLNPALGEHA